MQPDITQKGTHRMYGTTADYAVLGMDLKKKGIILGNG